MMSCLQFSYLFPRSSCKWCVNYSSAVEGIGRTKVDRVHQAGTEETPLPEDWVKGPGGGTKKKTC